MALKNLSLSTKSKENVVRRFPCFLNSEAQMADTRLESTPPDRKVQMGTSETICLRTASWTRKDVFSMVSS